MKRIITGLFLTILLVGCTTKTNNNETIPAKINPLGVSPLDSSVTTLNIDNYLFREDSVYIDLRPIEWVAKYGYIAGFTFIPFYNFLCRQSNNVNGFENIMFKMNVQDHSFTPNYKESVQILKSLFPEDKKIFLISSSGDECSYTMYLLEQYGYDLSAIYNIGPFSTASTLQIPAYDGMAGAKYLVKGNELIDGEQNVVFKLDVELTPFVS